LDLDLAFSNECGSGSAIFKPFPFSLVLDIFYPVCEKELFLNQESSEEEESFSVEVNSLCHPYKFKGLREEAPPLISADVEFRCCEALVNIELGLKYLTQMETLNRAKEEAFKKERENIERDNLKMSVPNKPIPMGYISQDSSRQCVQSESLDPDPTFLVIPDPGSGSKPDFLTNSRNIILKNRLQV